VTSSHSYMSASARVVCGSSQVWQTALCSNVWEINGSQPTSANVCAVCNGGTQGRAVCDKVLLEEERLCEGDSAVCIWRRHPGNDAQHPCDRGQCGRAAHAAWRGESAAIYGGGARGKPRRVGLPCAARLCHRAAGTPYSCHCSCLKRLTFEAPPTRKPLGI
jgi:hypothetical protein